MYSPPMDGQDSDRSEIKCCLRWLLGVLGVAGVVVAGVLWYYPGCRTVIAPTCPNGLPTVRVSAEPTSLALLLTGTGLLLLLIAINGRKLVSLKLPGGIEATTSESEKKALEKAVGPDAKKLKAIDEEAQDSSVVEPDAVPNDTIKLGGVDFGLYRTDAVPSQVFRELLAKAAEIPEKFSIEFVARKFGRGNHPWLVKFREDDRTWRVAFGGQGKSGATVTPL